MREDLLQLFGFTSLVEKEWYRLLVTVQGVGAKAAMAILGTLGPDGAGRAIALGDWGAIKAAPGVGPKLAQRVVMELKDKAPGIMALGSMSAGDLHPAPPEDDGVIEPALRRAASQPASPQANATADALSALINLGYNQSEAASAVARAAGETPAAAAAALIRAALKHLAPKG